jgi:hypothetical protein
MAQDRHFRGIPTPGQVGYLGTVALLEQKLGGLRWIVVHGPADEAFRELGRHTREEITRVIDVVPLLPKLRQHTAAPPNGQQLATVWRASQVSFPQAWDELAALADGAGVELDDLALLNVRGDLGPVGGCSDLAWRRGRSVIAHNEDGTAEQAGHCMLLTLLIDGQPPLTAFWYPGFLPSNAFTVTGSGLVWTIDSLTAQPPGPWAGRHFVARGLQLAATTIEDAIEYLRENPSAGGFSYTIGDRAGRIVIVEAAAGRHAWAEVGPTAPGGPLLWHTNHGRYIQCTEAAANSIQRGDLLASVKEPVDEPDAGWFLKILAGQPLPDGVWRDPSQGGTATLCTFVADLTAGEAVVLSGGAEAAAIPLRDLAAGIQRTG